MCGPSGAGRGPPCPARRPPRGRLFAPANASLAFGACRNTGVIDATALSGLPPRGRAALRGPRRRACGRSRPRSGTARRCSPRPRRSPRANPCARSSRGRSPTRSCPTRPRATPIEINRANDIARKAVESDAFQQAFVAALPGDVRPSRRGCARRRRARSRARVERDHDGRRHADPGLHAARRRRRTFPTSADRST